MKRLTSFIAVLVALTLLLSSAEQVAAESMQVVSPGAYENAEAPGSVTSGSPDGRHQQVFPASDFQSLPQNLRTITHVAVRPDGSLDSTLTITADRVVISLSTTSASPGSLSTTFADNIGADATVVCDAPVNWFSPNLGPPGGPKEFDFILALQTPFEYDPGEGNLLIDQTWSGFSNPTSYDFIDGAGPKAQLVGNSDPLATTAAYNTGGLVTQFTFTPEPSAFAGLLSLGIVGLIGYWWRRRKA